MEKLYNTVYLAGSIRQEILDKKDEVAIDWRDDWQRKLEKQGYRVLSPMRHKRNKNYDYTPRLCHRDLMDVQKADFVLVNYLRPSVGTAFEICYAVYVCRKEVIVVNNSGFDTEKLSPWIRHHAGEIVNTIEEAIEVLNWYQEEELNKDVVP